MKQQELKGRLAVILITSLKPYRGGVVPQCLCVCVCLGGCDERVLCVHIKLSKQNQQSIIHMQLSFEL